MVFGLGIIVGLAIAAFAFWRFVKASRDYSE